MISVPSDNCSSFSVDLTTPDVDGVLRGGGSMPRPAGKNSEAGSDLALSLQPDTSRMPVQALLEAYQSMCPSSAAA